MKKENKIKEIIDKLLIIIYFYWWVPVSLLIIGYLGLHIYALAYYSDVPLQDLPLLIYWILK